MSTSNLGLNLRNTGTNLSLLTGTLYLFGFGGGLYNYIEPVGGAKFFGIVLPGSQPTPTEAAYTKIHGIRNISSAIIGVGMVTYLQFSSACTTLPTGPFAAAAMRRALGYSMLINSVVAFTDGYILQQFSDDKRLSSEAVATAKRQRWGHAAVAVPLALLGLGWIYV